MLRRLIGSERSQSVVEFVLALPIFLVLVMGIIDFARATDNRARRMDSDVAPSLSSGTHMRWHCA